MPNRWVISENINRWREQLKTEKDPKKRATLERLVAEQEARVLADQRGKDD